MLTLGSLFDGIGGWQLAATRAGVTPVWSSEIENFPVAVTKFHFPNTLQLGDVRNIDAENIQPVDIICAGSPCQDLSIAGKRKGLAGEKSCLFLNAINIIRRMQHATDGQFPKFFVWENVAGAITSNGGLDFKTVLEEILQAEIPILKSKWANAGLVDGRICQLAWRILDAQFWGVPQRRQRIFLIADFTGQRAAKILFERVCLSRNFEEGSGERAGNTRRIEGGTDPAKSMTLYENHGQDSRYKKWDISPAVTATFGMGGNNTPFVCIQPPLTAKGAGAICTNNLVRRLTPLECERLMGLPDNWTLIDDKSYSDSARYKAIGNGMAQPIADWIIKRIVEVSKNDTI